MNMTFPQIIINNNNNESCLWMMMSLEFLSLNLIICESRGCLFEAIERRY